MLLDLADEPEPRSVLDLKIEPHEHENFTGFHDHSIHVFKWDFDSVAAPFIINAFIFALVLIRIAYHRIHKLAEVIPESCALIIMGALLGLLIRVTIGEHEHWKFLHFEVTTFFLILLPPIMLESAYSLRDRAFWQNLGTILIYAVVGTIFNIALVSLGIWALTTVGIISKNIDFLEACIFGSLICAVDPVAVLAIFEEVGVNKALYFMVFGESLLNDAVVIVVYKLMIGLHKIGVDKIGINDLLLGLASFFSVSCGAIVIGILWGTVCSFVTKYTTMIRIVEPVIIIATAYAAYLTAEMVHFSGIISIICCGIMQAQFASENLSVKSYITIQFATKCLAQVMESLIFIIVGVMLVNDTRVWQAWNTSFCLFSLLIIIVVRFIVTFGLTSGINQFERGVSRISFKEQFIIGYGGLRGAIAFSLCFMLGADAKEDDTIDEEYGLSLDTIHLFLCATYFILLFTVFVQGITMKPIVKLLRIQLSDEEGEEEFELFAEFNRNLILNTMAGVEEIIGHRGGYYWQMVITWFSHNFFRPLIQTKPSYSGKGLVELDEELQLKRQMPHNHSSVAMLEALDDETNEQIHLSNKQAMHLFDKEDADSSQPALTLPTLQPHKFTIEPLVDPNASEDDDIFHHLEEEREKERLTAIRQLAKLDKQKKTVRITLTSPENEASETPSGPRRRRQSLKQLRDNDIKALKFSLQKANHSKAVSKRRNILDEPVARRHRFQRRNTLGDTGEFRGRAMSDAT